VSASREALFRAAMAALITGDTEHLDQLFTEDVVGWSPILSVTNRQELAEAIGDREDGISNVVIEVDAVDVIGDKVIAEWRLAADHTGPLAIDEDLVVEPSGAHLVLAGASFGEIRGDKICAFRTYFDDAALLEQVLLPQSSS
jgi:ketosteroid isomerase-like protein